MKSKLSMLLLLAPILCAAQQSDRQHIASQLAIDQNLPFSGAVLVGNTLYIGGTTATDGKGKALPAPEEARRLMESVKRTVESAGMKMDDIVSVQVFCTDLGTYATFNNIYRAYVHRPYPARAFVGVSRLLFGARYELMGIAVKSHEVAPAPPSTGILKPSVPFAEAVN
jgi:2-iminobutanoate/2-iminopropanoate deaminase